ncbi:hypothetical protein B5X24_HaOG215579 [Helicoverpa armigera]|nr:hypothetical protein B5X24_HaOG215579 [Helicoverpa armigera]
MGKCSCTTICPAQLADHLYEDSLRGRISTSDAIIICIYSDDLRKTAGRSWMREAENRSQWRTLGEAYVQQWTAIG